jgi:hypothetical protein
MLLKADVMKSTVFALIATFLLLCPAGFAEKSAAQTVIAAVAAPPGPAPGRLERILAPTPSPDELRIFYQGPDGALATTWAVGPWATPVPITPPGAAQPNSAIAAVIHKRSGTFQAFYVQPDRALGRALQIGGWQANAITQPGLVRGDSPLVVFYGDGRLAFLAPDGALSIGVSTEDRFEVRTLKPIVGAGNGTGLVSFWDVGRDEWYAVYQATTGAIVDFQGLLKGFLAGRWYAPEQVQMAWPDTVRSRSPIAAHARGEYYDFSVFYVAFNGAVMETSLLRLADGRRKWIRPIDITPPDAVRADSPLTTVLRGNQRHLFYIGPDGAVMTTWALTVGRWERPFPITPSGAAGPGSRLAAVLRRDQLHVFYQRPDGALATTWAVGPWQTPFPITPPGAGRPGSSIAVVTGG